jgi:hypothetical protein
MAGIIPRDVFAQLDEVKPLPPENGGVVADPVSDDLAAGFDENLMAVINLSFPSLRAKRGSPFCLDCFVAYSSQ